MGAQISSISLPTPPSSSYPVSSLLPPRAKQHYGAGLVRTSARTLAANSLPSASLLSPSPSPSSTPPPSMLSLSSSPLPLLPSSSLSSLPCSSVSSQVVDSYAIGPPPVAFVTEKQVAFVQTEKEKEKEKKLEQERVEDGDEDDDELWLEIRKEAKSKAAEEPVLASYFSSTVLSHRSLECVLAFHLSNKLSNTTLLSTQLYTLFVDILMDDAGIRAAMRADIRAVRRRDPACTSYCDTLLNFKGFLACQTHRVAHHLWVQGRTSLALALQSRVSEVFAVDIHPAAIVGRGVLLDHATGLVVGETATIGNNVSILHHVTLGGTGKYGGDRHPKIGDGVLIGAGATILGNVVIGEGAKIGAGSVVLTNIPPKTTAVGNPARLVGGKKAPKQLRETPSQTMDHTSFMSHWSDYVI